MKSEKFSLNLFIIFLLHVTHLFSFKHHDKIILHQPFTKKQKFLGLPIEFSPSSSRNTIKSQNLSLIYNGGSIINKKPSDQSSPYQVTFNCKDGNVVTTSDIAEKFQIVEDGGTDLAVLNIKKKLLVNLIDIDKSKKSVASLRPKELKDTFEAAVKLGMRGHAIQSLAVKCALLADLDINKDIIHREENNNVIFSPDYEKLKNIFQNINNGQFFGEIIKWSVGGKKLDLSYQGLNSLNGIELLASPSILASILKPKRTQYFFPDDIKRIDVSGNNLRSLRLSLLKKVFPNLNTVFAQHNNIEKLDSSDLALMSCMNIDLSGNRISSVPTSLWRVPQDCQVNLDKNRLSQKACEAFNTMMTAPSWMQVFDDAVRSVLINRAVNYTPLVIASSSILVKSGGMDYVLTFIDKFCEKFLKTDGILPAAIGLSLFIEVPFLIVHIPVFGIQNFLIKKLKPSLSFNPGDLSLDSQFHRESLNNGLAHKYSNSNGLKMLLSTRSLP